MQPATCWQWGLHELLLAVFSFGAPAPHARRLSDLLSRASCLPVVEPTTRHDSACRWPTSCSAAALRRCLSDALPDPGADPN
jgi:hypothetical protein